MLDSKIPDGPLADKWTKHKDNVRLVNPANKRLIDVIVVGTGLAGSSAAASLAEMGYSVKAFCFQDSPRRAHSIAAQGGINAAKNYQNDGDSTHRLFYDTIKGGDYRSREANVHRLAEVSASIIDQCVMQGVPFARDYGGMLDNRSFGGVQVSRTFYAKGQTGQQLLLGAYSALSRQIGQGKVEMFSRHEMMDVVVVDGKARGIIARDLITGEIERHSAHAVVLCTGGYGNAFFLSTNAMGSNASAAWKAHRRGSYFANPCYTQIHPTCIPVSDDAQSKLTLMSESLRNDGRIWVPKHSKDVEAIRNGSLKPVDLAATTTWSAVTRPLETSSLVTLLRAQQKSVVMPAWASTTRAKPFFLTSPVQSPVTEARQPMSAASKNRRRKKFATWAWQRWKPNTAISFGCTSRSQRIIRMRRQ
jgi:succinate dehydrogenase / fumarate reductase flavoprotein subunit